jgi:hypothetical protein
MRRMRAIIKVIPNIEKREKMFFINGMVTASLPITDIVFGLCQFFGTKDVDIKRQQIIET